MSLALKKLFVGGHIASYENVPPMRESTFVRSCALMTKSKIQMINFSINNSYQNKTHYKAVKSDDIKEQPYLRKSYIFRVRYKEIF